MKHIPLFASLLFLLLSSSCGSKLSQGVVKESYIHKYGVAMSKKDWEARGSHGKVVTTMKTGATLSKSYKGGVLHGKSTTTFPHSTIVEKTEIYEEGELFSITRHFQSGTPMWEEAFPSQHERRLTNWYEDGTPQSIENYKQTSLDKGEYFSYSNELESRIDTGEGLRVRRDRFGNLLSKDLVKHGQMLLRTTYYPNGDPESITPYVDGLAHGQRKTFHMGGEPKALEEWKSGVQDGVTTVFQNGTKWAEVAYSKGVKHGTELRYRDGEIVVEDIQWSHDERHGPSRTFIGDVTSTQWYLKGHPVPKYVFEQAIR